MFKFSSFSPSAWKFTTHTERGYSIKYFLSSVGSKLLKWRNVSSMTWTDFVREYCMQYTGIPLYTDLYGHRLTKDLSRKNKLIHLLLNTDKINTDSGHFSVIRIRRSQTMFTSFYGHWLSVPWMPSLCFDGQL